MNNRRFKAWLVLILTVVVGIPIMLGATIIYSLIGAWELLTHYVRQESKVVRQLYRETK